VGERAKPEELIVGNLGERKGLIERDGSLLLEKLFRKVVKQIYRPVLPETECARIEIISLTESVWDVNRAAAPLQPAACAHNALTGPLRHGHLPGGTDTFFLPRRSAHLHPLRTLPHARGSP